MTETGDGLYQRGKVWYMNFHHIGTRVHRSCKTGNRTVAAKMAAEERTRIENEYLAGDSEKMLTLSEAVERQYKRHWRKLRDGDNYRRLGLAAVTHLGDVPLTDITTRSVSAYKAALEDKGLATGTINSYLQSLRATLRAAHREWELLDRVPMFHMDVPKNHVDRVISQAEEAALLRRIRATPVRNDREDPGTIADTIAVLIDTGIRPRELRLSRFGRHIKLDQGLIYLTEDITKTSKPRVVPMTARVKAICARRQASHPDQPFPLIRQTLSKAFVRIRAAMGIADKNFRLYACRHTACTRMLEAGMDFHAVMKIMGHTSQAMTQRYEHCAPTYLIDQLKRLDVERRDLTLIGGEQSVASTVAGERAAAGI